MAHPQDSDTLAPLVARIVDGVDRKSAERQKAPVVPKVWLTPAEAGTYLGVHPVTLSNWRKAGRGPRFHTINHKFIRYRIGALDAWVVSGDGGSDATS
jgi:hypothetical protein